MGKAGLNKARGKALSFLLMLGGAPEQFKSRHVSTISFAHMFAQLICWVRA